MKNYILLGVGFAVALAATLALLAAPQNASANYGNFTFDCTHVTGSFTNFPNANNNTVTLKAVVNGQTYTKDISFNGSSGSGELDFPSSGVSNTVITVSAVWNTNGVHSSAGPVSQTFDCSKPCVPVTVTVTTTNTQTVTAPPVTITQTTPAQTVTVTTPGQTRTVTNTITNTVTQTVTNNVTTPGPTTTVTQTTPGKTVTVIHKVKSPPKIVVKWKWRKSCPPPKHHANRCIKKGGCVRFTGSAK